MDTARVRNFLTLGPLHLHSSPDTAVVREFRDFAVKRIQKLPILCPFKFMNWERQNWLIYANINLNNRTSWPVFDLSGYVNDQDISPYKIGMNYTILLPDTNLIVNNFKLIGVDWKIKCYFLSGCLTLPRNLNEYATMAHLGRCILLGAVACNHIAYNHNAAFFKADLTIFQEHGGWDGMTLISADPFLVFDCGLIPPGHDCSPILLRFLPCFVGADLVTLALTSRVLKHSNIILHIN